MVVTDSWAEQRVLMRAFSECNDQTRPTIELHGAQLAIGPAGTDPHGAWGIHVEPPVDGRAQELRAQLEYAAKRLAGSKGNPPRLEDELPNFERKRTQYWAPGTPRDLPPEPAPIRRRTPLPMYYEPSMVAPPIASPVIPSAPKPVGRRRKRGWTSPVPPRPAHELNALRAAVGSTTATGFAAGPTLPPRHLAGASQRGLASLASRTLPPGLALGDVERDVLNALSEAGSLSVERIAAIAGVADGAAWMADFAKRLNAHGVDLICADSPGDGRPVYSLRR